MYPMFKTLGLPLQTSVPAAMQAKHILLKYGLIQPWRPGKFLDILEGL